MTMALSTVGAEASLNDGLCTAAAKVVAVTVAVVVAGVAAMMGCFLPIWAAMECCCHTLHTHAHAQPTASSLNCHIQNCVDQGSNSDA